MGINAEIQEKEYGGDMKENQMLGIAHTKQIKNTPRQNLPQGLPKVKSQGGNPRAHCLYLVLQSNTARSGIPAILRLFGI